MKTKMFILILLFVIPFGCKEEKKIEIIPTEEVYFPLYEVNEFPEILDQTKGKPNKIIIRLIDTVKQIYQSMSEKEKETFVVDYRFLVNEKGRVDKIQVIKSKYPDIDKIVSEVVKDLEFTSAIKEGKNVKFIFPWSYNNETLKLLTQPNQGSDQNIYFVAVEEMPAPIGGIQSIQSKIKYPEIAKRAGIEGKVYVLAFIDENGTVTEAKIIKGIGAGCDETAIDAIKQTKFTPGRQRGNPVKVQVSIPIVFKLQ